MQQHLRSPLCSELAVHFQLCLAPHLDLRVQGAVHLRLQGVIYLNLRVEEFVGVCGRVCGRVCVTLNVRSFVGLREVYVAQRGEVHAGV